MPRVCEDLGLAKVPHHTALHKADQRLLKISNVRTLLNASVTALLTPQKETPREVKPAAVDSTGL